MFGELKKPLLYKNINIPIIGPNPKIAKSDAAQQLDFNEFKNMFNSLKPIAKAVGKDII